MAVDQRHRGQCQRFGVACANLAAAYGTIGSCFIVTGFLQGGVAEAWNERCCELREPWRRLHIASAILAVNGVSGNIKRMQQELETANDAEIVFHNPPSVFCMQCVLRAVYWGTPLPAQCCFWRQTAKTPLADQLQVGQSFNEGQGMLLSVIVTTSPVPSNPNTELLERVLASHRASQEG